MSAPRLAMPRPRGRRPASSVPASRIVRVEPLVASTDLLGALWDEGDRLGAVVRAVAKTTGVPAAIIWRREGLRLLLAHRHGDVALAAEAAAGLDGPDVPALPRELRADERRAIDVMRLHNRDFATLSLHSATIALGPIAGSAIPRRDRARLVDLSPLIDAVIGEALRSVARDSELAELRAAREAALRGPDAADRDAAARQLAALRGLARALDSRTSDSAHHHKLVARSAEALAQRMGLSVPERREIVAAALVHDVGMLALEPNPTAERAHAALGADMAALVPGGATLAPLIRAHHEWYDGTGFPAGLVGEAIPQGARILGAAEFYVESLQSGGADRDPARLAREIRARRGTRLDPRCADEIVAMLGQSPPLS